MAVDMLKAMFSVQYENQLKRGNIAKISGSDVMKQQYINQMLLACYEEVTEIMRETAYKNPDFVTFGWKKSQVLDEQKMQDEIIDLWHFLMNLAIVANMTPEMFYNKYLEKNNINEKRMAGDY